MTSLKDLELYRLDIVFSDLTIAKDGLSASYLDKKLIKRNDLKNWMIEELKKLKKLEEQETIYNYKVTQNVLIDWIKKKFNITSEDLK